MAATQQRCSLLKRERQFNQKLSQISDGDSTIIIGRCSTVGTQLRYGADEGNLGRGCDEGESYWIGALHLQEC